MERTKNSYRSVCIEVFDFPVVIQLTVNLPGAVNEIIRGSVP